MLVLNTTEIENSMESNVDIDTFYIANICTLRSELGLLDADDRDTVIYESNAQR